VLKKGQAGGLSHGGAEQDVAFKDIAAVIGRRLNLPVVSKVREEAKERFGWFAHFARIDNRASSGCCERLGWTPVLRLCSKIWTSTISTLDHSLCLGRPIECPGMTMCHFRTAWRRPNARH
jgi:hypothetical protein